jgi:hypothetical protein
MSPPFPLSFTKMHYQKHMRKAKVLNSKIEMYDFVADNITSADGILCEFGVFQGFSINYIASKIPKTIHGFDSFEGLPEFWRSGFDQHFFMVQDHNQIKFRSNVVIHKGLFNRTIPEFKEENPRKVSFIHVDCDLYSSTKTIFDLLGDRISSGCVILFDEYFNYPGWRMHEFKAFREFIKENKLNYEYLAYVSTDEQVAVKITG